MIRTHAREQINDTQLANALGLVADERQALRNHLAQLDLWEQRSTAHRAQLEALQQLAQDAKRNLADPTPQDQRESTNSSNYRSSLRPTGRSISKAASPPTDSPNPRRPLGRFHKEPLGTPDLRLLIALMASRTLGERPKGRQVRDGVFVCMTMRDTLTPCRKPFLCAWMKKPFERSAPSKPPD